MSAQPTSDSEDPGIVRFLLDGEVVEVRDPHPTRTVLQFLREDLRRAGTKEGCAEGDCGACTVVVAEPAADGGVRLQAVNSCIQFLPTLDGKELVTVESLRGADGGLHPVQQAMVDCHGSQCGFCTPGFVMSLFALYKNNTSPTRREIDDALAGNLCRCTGYNPIIKAAREMYRLAACSEEAAGWLATPCGKEGSDDAEHAALLQSVARDGSLRAGHGDGRYFAPREAAELAGILEEHPDATLLAGGTDVGLWVTKQLRDLPILIYTRNVAELQRLEVTDTHLDVGAAVTLTDAMPAIVNLYPHLEELLLRFASPPIRNAATLGGNIANGSPIGDSMPALLALDATVVLQRVGASRELPLADFYPGYRRTALEPGEFVERVRIPLPAETSVLRSYKVSKRFDQDIAAVCGAWRLELDGTRIAGARVAYGGMAEVPKRAANCERALAGAEWNEQTARQAMAALDEDYRPISDMRASSGYRQLVARNLLYRFWLETGGGEAARVYDYGRQKLA